MNILLLLVILAYLTFDAISSMQETKELKNMVITEKERISLYKKWTIWGWVPVGIIVVFSFFTEVNIANLGFRKMILSDYSLINTSVFLIFGVLFLIKIYTVILFLASERYRKSVADEIEKSDDIVTKILIPRTVKEKSYMFFVSLTAGICEEITFRGCIMFLLMDIFPGMPSFLVGVVSSLLFGLFHFYQGLSGVILTGLLGLLFAGLFIATDSIIPGIILHFFMDFAGVFILREKM